MCVVVCVVVCCCVWLLCVVVVCGCCVWLCVCCCCVCVLCVLCVLLWLLFLLFVWCLLLFIVVVLVRGGGVVVGLDPPAPDALAPDRPKFRFCLSLPPHVRSVCLSLSLGFFSLNFGGGF